MQALMALQGPRENGVLEEGGRLLVWTVGWAGRPHPEVRWEGREPLQDHAGQSPLLSRSGGEKGLRGSGAGTLGVPLQGTRRVGGHLGVAGRLSGTVSPFRAEQGTSLETPSRARVPWVHLRSHCSEAPPASSGRQLTGGVNLGLRVPPLPSPPDWVSLPEGPF